MIKSRIVEEHKGVTYVEVIYDDKVKQFIGKMMEKFGYRYAETVIDEAIHLGFEQLENSMRMKK